MVPKKSEIWTHFSDEGEHKYKCLYCEQILPMKTKSSSTLIGHMSQKHPTILIKPKQEPIKEEIPVLPSTSTNSPIVSVISSKAISSKLPGRRTSKIWTYFSKVVDGRVKCLYCGSRLSVRSKSTSTLMRHIKQKHSYLLTKRQPMNKTIPVQQPQTPTSTAKGINGVRAISGTPLSVSKQQKIDEQLIQMIINDCHPYSFVEGIGFTALISELNPHYKLPTPEMLLDSMIPPLYNQTVDIVKMRLKRANSICLTTDGWTSWTGDIFCSFTAHYIVEEDSKTFLTSDLLGCTFYGEADSAEYMYSIIKELIAEWDIENKIVAVVSDSATKIREAISLGNWTVLDCFACSLNLSILSGLKEIKEILKKIENIVAYVTQSDDTSARLKDTAKKMNITPIKLKMHQVTKWNSTYDMISRFVQMKDAIKLILANLNKANAESVIALQDEEWIMAEQLLKVLKVCYAISTAIISDGNARASYIIYFYEQLNTCLNAFDLSTISPPLTDMVDKLKREVQLRFSCLEENELIAQATLLDPRFKKFGFIDQNKYKQAVDNLYFTITNTDIKYETDKINETVIKGENQDTLDIENKLHTENQSDPEHLLQSLWTNFDIEVQQNVKSDNPRALVIAEVDKYLDEPILNRKDNFGKCQDPLIWWHQRKDIYPNLYNFMKSRLCIMSTYLPCDGIFSKRWHQFDERRRELSDEEVNQVVFLNYNLKNKD